MAPPKQEELESMREGTQNFRIITNTKVSLRLPCEGVESGFLPVRITFPSIYPFEPAVLSVVDGIPEPKRKKVEEAWAEQAAARSGPEGAPHAKAVLDWLRERISSLVSDRPAPAPKAAPRRAGSEGEASGSGEEDEDEDEEDEDEGEEEEEEDDRVTGGAAEDLAMLGFGGGAGGQAERPPRPPRDSPPPRAPRGGGGGGGSSEEPAPLPAASRGGPSANPKRGTELRLHGLDIFEIGILEFTSMRAVVACARCKAQNEITITKGAGFSTRADCPKCHTPQSIAFRPDPMYANQPVAGYFDLDGANMFDLLPSDCAAHCFGCSARVNFKGVSVATTYDKTCGQCHARLTLRYEKATFRKIAEGGAGSSASGGGGSGARAGGSGSSSSKRDPNLPPAGQPLPDTGTCKHYKNSHRWLRFPCCGRAYPCDDCHNETAGHEAKYANRMICGFCATEQPYSNDKCAGCKKEMAKSGLRRDLMSDKDARKHRNSEMKTKSKKSERVGQKKLV
eukprot:tig00001493_g8981.t1